jgi:adenylate cyclase
MGSGSPSEELLRAERVERRLAAILAADIAGYSRLIGLDEEGTLARLRSLRHEAIAPMVALHRGRIVKTTGDGMLIEFQSAVDAVRCAVAVHGANAKHESAVPQERRIAFRVGINLGDIVVEGEDILGDGVNIAARLVDKT